MVVGLLEFWIATPFPFHIDRKDALLLVESNNEPNKLEFE